MDNMVLDQSPTSHGMKTNTYCKKCLMPGSRLRIVFDDNDVCSACANADEKQQFNWDER